MNAKELREILGARAALKERGVRAAVATLLKVEGSAYRGPGARLLVSEDGESWGFVSGGCVEGDLLEKAREVIRRGEARLVLYDTTAPGDALWGSGLGCNGVVTILVEPAEGAALDPLEFARECLGRGTGLLATLFRADGRGREAVSRLVLYPGGELRSEIDDRDLAAAVEAAARECLATGRTGLIGLPSDGVDLDLLVERLGPPLTLLIIGAGPDARPLAAVASNLGWRAVVVDWREELVRRERFPEAESVLLLRPEELSAALPAAGETAAVLMSHHFPMDADYLERLMGQPFTYLGLLGPKKRAEGLLSELARRGVRPTPDQMRCLHGPVGLDIGAEGPEEIALAVAAEILAESRGAGGGPLRDRAGPLHARAGA